MLNAVDAQTPLVRHWEADRLWVLAVFLEVAVFRCFRTSASNWELAEANNSMLFRIDWLLSIIWNVCWTTPIIKLLIINKLVKSDFFFRKNTGHSKADWQNNYYLLITTVCWGTCCTVLHLSPNWKPSQHTGRAQNRHIENKNWVFFHTALPLTVHEMTSDSFFSVLPDSLKENNQKVHARTISKRIAP